MNNSVAKASIQIIKPIEEVFLALTKASQLPNFFAHSSADLNEKTTVQWWFEEFPEKFDVHILKVEAPHTLHFDWFGGIEGKIVKIHLRSFEQDATVVEIEETGLKISDDGQWEALQQTEGWANFLACLKAYLEYGIRLRKRAFDFKKTP
jgi:uncharacterized protein YndB with AHSA1/START domain